MTHTTDCRVKDEYRETVDEIAELFWSGNEAAAHEMCLDLGWERLGKGVGRVAYRTSSPDDDDVDVQREHPCVTKFAIQHAKFDGQWQNRVEIQQYDAFPDPLKTATVDNIPLIVPLRDYQRGKYLWITQPEVDPTGGNAGVVEAELGEYGWFCPDIHSGNVGEMHGESVLLDYGVRCDHREPPGAVAEYIAGKLEDFGCQAVAVEDIGGVYEISFLPPEWVIDTGPPVVESRIPVDERSETTAMEIAFGGYPADEYDRLEDAIEGAARKTQGDIGGIWTVNMQRSEVREEGVVTVSWYVDFLEFMQSEMVRRGPDPDQVIDIYREFADRVHANFPLGETEEGQAPKPDPVGAIPGNHTAIIERDDYTIQFGGFDIDDALFGIERSELPFYLEVNVAARPGITSEWSGIDVDVDAIGPDGSLWGNASIELVGLPGDEDDIDGTFLYHFFVNPDARRMGVGTAMFDVYLAVAAWVGGSTRGTFGQNEMESTAFLESAGVRPAEIHVVESSAWLGDETVGFSMDIEEFVRENDFIRVDVDMERPNIGREIDEAVIGGDIDESIEFGNPFESTGDLLDDLEMAAFEGDDVVAEVIEHYDGREIKDDGDVTYYTAIDPSTGEMVVVYHEDDYVDITPADEWMWDSWTWDGGLEDFLGYDMNEQFNEGFWESPSTLYHATGPEAAEAILESELGRRNKTRGLGNRSVGGAVFTTTDPGGWQEIYGPVLFEIDTRAMKEGGLTPRVEREPEIVEAEMREAVARSIGLDDFYADRPGDVDPTTVIVYGDIPAEYLDIAEGADRLVEAGVDAGVVDDTGPFEQFEIGDEKFLNYGDEITATVDGERVQGEVREVVDDLVAIETDDGGRMTVDIFDIEAYRNLGDGDLDDKRRVLKEYFENAGVGTHSRSLSDWTDDAIFGEIQDHLRSVRDVARTSPVYDDHPTEEFIAAALATVSEDDAERLIDIQAASKMDLPETMHVFRGISVDRDAFLDRAEASMESGDPIVDDGFQSTSLDPDVGRGFGNVLLDIETDHGVYVRAASEHAGEDEILLPAGTEYEVTAVDRDAGVVNAVARGGFDFRGFNVDEIRDIMDGEEVSYREAVERIL